MPTLRSAIGGSWLDGASCRQRRYPRARRIGAPPWVKMIQINAERYAFDPSRTVLFEVVHHIPRRDDRHLEFLIESPDVPPRGVVRVATESAGPLRERADGARKVAVEEPDQWDVDAPCGAFRDPGHEEWTPDFDHAGLLMLDDPPNRARRQHEAVRALGRDPRAAQPIAAHAIAGRDGVASARDDEHVPERRSGLDILRLLQQVCADPATRLAKPLRDIQDAELGVAAALFRQDRFSEIKVGRRTGRRKERLFDGRHSGRSHVTQLRSGTLSSRRSCERRGHRRPMVFYSVRKRARRYHAAVSVSRRTLAYSYP